MTSLVARDEGLGQHADRPRLAGEPIANFVDFHPATLDVIAGRALAANGQRFASAFRRSFNNFSASSIFFRT
jgi:hypothetical protein